jgi:signal transduction histidine kinase
MDATDAPAGMDSDPTRMRQVLLNLLVNAIKFTDAGSVALRCYRPRAGLVAFSVQDTGPGITPEEQERVFDEFERGELVDTGVEGTGLGLPISRGLAEALGGRLEMASEVGVGSTFTLVLPEATVPAVRRDRQGGARPARA